MARLTCRKRLNPDFKVQGDLVLRLPGETDCTFTCGRTVIGKATVVRDDDSAIYPWKIVVSSGGETKEVRRTSRRKAWLLLEQIAASVDCGGEDDSR